MMTVVEQSGPARTLPDPPPRKTAAGDVSSTRHSAAGSLRSLFRHYRGRILLTYGLFSLENVLRLIQPLVLGLAINDLLHASYFGLLLFVAQHLSYLLMGLLRRVYDARAFSAIYADLATQLVVTQREGMVEVSRVAARSDLSRAFVDFFERDLPVVMRSLFSVIGALVLLALYDWLLVPLCLALLVPAYLLNRVYGRKTLLYSGRLHDEFEREVEVISDGRASEVRGHYSRVGHWRVKLADWEARNFGMMELFVLGLIAATLVRSCTLGTAPGDIFAVFRYVLMFVMGLDSVPQLVQQVSRLRDIGGRMRNTPEIP